MSPVRRVVTGQRAGRGIVLYDGPAPNVRVRQASGIVSTLLWATDEVPADIAGAADRSLREIGVPPPASGTIFRVVDFPPEQGTRSREAILREMGVAAGGAARHPGMHRTRSIDYAVVLEGEIDMLLEDSEVHLRAGDVLVQQGTDHAWVNRSGAPCRIAFVLIDAQEPPAA